MYSRGEKSFSFLRSDLPRGKEGQRGKGQRQQAEEIVQFRSKDDEYRPGDGAELGTGDSEVKSACAACGTFAAQ